MEKLDNFGGGFKAYNILSLKDLAGVSESDLQLCCGLSPLAASRLARLVSPSNPTSPLRGGVGAKVRLLRRWLLVAAG